MFTEIVLSSVIATVAPVSVAYALKPVPLSDTTCPAGPELGSTDSVPDVTVAFARPAEAGHAV